jgi:DNA polymerase-3 subunit delta
LFPVPLESNVFQLVDSISYINPGTALSILNDLLLDSEPIPVILAMIIRQFRLLLNTKLLIQKGYSVQDLGSKLGVPPFISSSLYKLSSKYTEKQLENRLKCCLNTDAAIKSGKMEQRLALESLIVEFAR